MTATSNPWVPGRSAWTVLAVLVLGAIACKPITHTPEEQTTKHLQFLQKALAKFKEDHRRYPSQEEGLSALIGSYVVGEQALNDAWRHRAVYKMGETGSFFVYSVGPNGRDESGEGDDIVLRSEGNACSNEARQHWAQAASRKLQAASCKLYVADGGLQAKESSATEPRYSKNPLSFNTLSDLSGRPATARWTSVAVSIWG